MQSDSSLPTASASGVALIADISCAPAPLLSQKARSALAARQYRARKKAHKPTRVYHSHEQLQALTKKRKDELADSEREAVRKFLFRQRTALAAGALPQVEAPTASTLTAAAVDGSIPPLVFPAAASSVTAAATSPAAAAAASTPAEPIASGAAAVPSAPLILISDNDDDDVDTGAPSRLQQCVRRFHEEAARHALGHPYKLHRDQQAALMQVVEQRVALESTAVPHVAVLTARDRRQVELVTGLVMENPTSSTASIARTCTTARTANASIARVQVNS